MPSISERLAEFAADLSLDRVPGAVAERAKHLILDAVGCGFAARDQEFAQRIAGSVAKLAGEGPRRVLGLPLRLPGRDAALVNGALMHGLDYDDTHAAGIIHLTVGALPAALAVSAQRDTSGAQLLAAYIAALEVGARLASAVKGGFHQVGFHPTSLVGTFAAAIAAGKLAGLSRAQLATAQGVALSFASGPLQFIDDGSWTKRLHPGWAASCGITAAALASDDIQAPREAYEGRFGLYRTHLSPEAFARCDLAIATAGLGTVWEVDNVAVKPYPACHLLHGCADAAIALHRKGLDIARVRSVKAYIAEGAVQAVCEPLAAKRRPKSDYDAKFSLPYAVASGLARGRLGLAELLPQAFTEPGIERLMDRSEYVVDERADFPRFYGGEVEVALDDGRTLRERVAINRGNPERALTNGEIEAKFFENCSLNLDRARAKKIRDLVLALESVPAAELEKALAG